MKLLVITNYLDQESGRGRYSLKVCEELLKRVDGLDVLVERIHYPEKFSQRALYTKDSALNFFRNCLLARRLARGVAVVHAFDVWPYAIYGFAATIVSPRPLFVSAIGTYSIPPARLSVKKYFMNRALTAARKVFCISEYTQKRLRARCPGVYSEVICMGTTQFNPESVSSTQSTVGGRYPRLLTVGAIEPRKAQLDTVKAVELLRRDFPAVHYNIVGRKDGEVYYNMLKAYIASHGLENSITLRTDVETNEALAELYTSSEVFLLNSVNEGEHFEGFGLVILEANQYGVPTVGSRDTGIESAIQDGYNGYLAKQHDPADIAEKVRMILKKDRSIWETQCREFASRFTWEKTVEMYVAYYRKSHV